jgi:2-phospho-L-lactate/phosphoenolpyruvate guanylyltransferase
VAAWAIIPVKPFSVGKSRLADTLDASERAALNRRMFEHVFEVAAQVLGPERILVVSADRSLLAEVRRLKAHTVQEPEPGDLNLALALADRFAAAHGAQTLIVLPCDLPELAGGDIAALLQALGPPPSCAIAPDASEQGTNALALSPPVENVYRFGPQSFAAHKQAAHALGYRIEIVRRPGLARDIDTPDDYRAWQARDG